MADVASEDPLSTTTTSSVSWPVAMTLAMASPMNAAASKAGMTTPTLGSGTGGLSLAGDGDAHHTQQLALHGRAVIGAVGAVHAPAHEHVVEHRVAPAGVLQAREPVGVAGDGEALVERPDGAQGLAADQPAAGDPPRLGLGEPVLPEPLGARHPRL